MSFNQYGASTGRPRRCGWYDAVVVRYSARINGLDAIALTKLDVLDGLTEVKICTGYKTPSGLLTEFPADLRLLTNAEPVYETLPGWSSPTKGVTRMSDLPREAQRYIARLEEVSGASCGLVSHRLRSPRDDHQAGFGGRRLDGDGPVRGGTLRPRLAACRRRTRLVSQKRPTASASASKNSMPAR